MNKLQTVVRVEAHRVVTETVTKTKRHDYKNGGFRLEETITRLTTETDYALLECGHWREQRPNGPLVRNAKKLGCYECEQIERAEKYGTPYIKPENGPGD